MKTLTDIEGVYANGMHCGIKSGDARDLAFVYVPDAVASAGVFTRNHFRAPSVVHSEKAVESSCLKAVIVNSGNANAATGKEGYANVKQTAQLAADRLSVKPDQVAVASTGIIGVQLPMDKLSAGLNSLLAEKHAANGHHAADAIRTLDTVSKEVYLETEIDGKTLRVAGICKGVGMIAPNMATMLAFMATDANIDSPALSDILKNAAADSFNMVSVDSDTSTNDMVLAFANGKSGADLSTSAARGRLQDLFTDSCKTLAKMMAKDGEGAEKLITVEIEGAKNKVEAKKIALTVVSSPLVKTAVAGADPNWGRVLMALGKNPDVEVNPAKLDLWYGDLQILSNSEPTNYQIDQIRDILNNNEVLIRANLNIADGQATAWGCDLTHGYIDINTQYN